MKHSQFQLFKRDPDGDSVVIIQNKTYLTRKNLLAKCGYFLKMMEDQNIFFISNQQIDNEIFVKVMITLYGMRLNFSKDWQIVEILKISQFLQYEAVFQEIMFDIEKNFEDYSFFLLYSVGQTFKIKWLQQKCDQCLRIFQFEQLNFSKYDLFQLQLYFFDEIIKKHQNLKQRGFIKGLSQKNIIKIIEQYSETNNCELKPQQVMRLSVEDANRIQLVQKLRQNQRTKKMQGLIRKRTKTWDDCSTTQSPSLKYITKKLSHAHGYSESKKSILSISKNIKKQCKQETPTPQATTLQPLIKYPETPSTNYDDNQNHLWCIDPQNDHKFINNQQTQIVSSPHISSIFRN